MLSRFKWYRRWRGGRWSRVTGLMWGRNWVRHRAESLEQAEENYQ